MSPSARQWLPGETKQRAKSVWSAPRFGGVTRREDATLEASDASRSSRASPSDRASRTDRARASTTRRRPGLERRLLLQRLSLSLERARARSLATSLGPRRAAMRRDAVDGLSRVLSVRSREGAGGWGGGAGLTSLALALVFLGFFRRSRLQQ